MRALQFLFMAVVVAGLCSTAAAEMFGEDFESYSAGTNLQNVNGWKGWNGASGASAPVSDDFAYSGSNSVEIVPAADLVHEFDFAGGTWTFSAMQYIPSGGNGETYFIILNSYDDNANQDWSIQTRYNLATGAITTWTGAVDATVVFDEWIELKYIIDLDNNTVDEYYNGELIDTRQWDDNDHGTIGAIDLYGNNASSVYYDDIAVVQGGEPTPADGQEYVARDSALEWPAGVFAATYDVYFSTDYEAVSGADRANPMDVLISQDQADTSFDPEGLFDFGQVYYWRVDAVSADGRITTGEVWTFTAEPFYYPVANVTATSNTTPEGDAVPANTVNGSGLNADDQHSRADDTMWLGVPTGDDPVYIEFEFDRVYKLYEMLVWNYNGEFELLLSFGIKDVSVEYSTDGADWTALGDVTLAQGTAQADYVANTTIDFGGVAAKFVRLTVNSSYGMFGKYGLSEVRFLYLPTHAADPQPADEAADVDVNTVLNWRPGREAVTHDVYFGTDSEALALATATDVASYVPGTLDLETTYYWKVDEINDAEAISVWEGAVWSFTTEAFIVLDDFEGYTDNEGSRIYESWADGYTNETGSTVGYFEAPFAEQTIVNSGSQSMPFFYDNASTSTSEVDLTLSQDWTASRIKSLTLYFYGDPDNTGQLYVKINGTKVAYDGDITQEAWQEWTIDLAGLGINLTNVTQLTIGVEGSGTTGQFFIDDIRLYP